MSGWLPLSAFAGQTYIDHAAAKPSRQAICNLEVHLLKHSEKQNIDDITKHYFSRGLYAREIFIPKNHFIVGKVHKYENMNILSSGKLLVTTEQGVRVLEAPCVVVSPAGTKRAAYALEDTTWVTIHPTDERDVSVIEQQFIEPPDLLDYNEDPEVMKQLGIIKDSLLPK